jgi:hypothetical protein
VYQVMVVVVVVVRGRVQHVLADAEWALMAWPPPTQHLRGRVSHSSWHTADTAISRTDTRYHF